MKQSLFLDALLLICCGCLSAVSIIACSSSSDRVKVELVEGRYFINAYGDSVTIKGVGGTNALEVAKASGANACRTWGGDVGSIRRTIESASANGMYIMQGIWLPQDAGPYSDPEFRAKTLEECAALAREFKDDRSIIIWGLGNEIDLAGKGNVPEAWAFVDEIARTMKKIDPNHLYATVISYNREALDMVAEYAPSLDLVGINCYGGIEELANTVASSKYDGPYLVTEWGPTGWWETDTTEWGAPIEQTSEEKRQVYEYRYKVLSQDPACMGSFCFLWGQKEERTPTWFSMFVENDVEGLPLCGQKTPMVEAMHRNWTSEEPENTAPVIESIVAGRRRLTAADSPKFTIYSSYVPVYVTVYDKEDDIDCYVWEILKEATDTATGGAWEPRPERVGDVFVSDSPTQHFTVTEAGNYRVYVYVLDKSGYVSTANIPIRFGTLNEVFPEAVDISFWEQYSKAEKSSFLKSGAIETSIVGIYNDSFKISDDEETFKCLHLLSDYKYGCSQADAIVDAFYFHCFSKILKMADGALAEVMGNYCWWIVKRSPEYSILYMKSHKDIRDKFVQYIAYELYFSQDQEGDYKKLMNYLGVDSSFAEKFVTEVKDCVREEEEN